MALATTGCFQVRKAISRALYRETGTTEKKSAIAPIRVIATNRGYRAHRGYRTDRGYRTHRNHGTLVRQKKLVGVIAPVGVIAQGCDKSPRKE